MRSVGSIRRADLPLVRADRPGCVVMQGYSCRAVLRRSTFGRDFLPCVQPSHEHVISLSPTSRWLVPTREKVDIDDLKNPEYRKGRRKAGANRNAGAAAAPRTR